MELVHNFPTSSLRNIFTKSLEALYKGKSVIIEGEIATGKTELCKKIKKELVSNEYSVLLTSGKSLDSIEKEILSLIKNDLGIKLVDILPNISNKSKILKEIILTIIKNKENQLIRKKIITENEKMILYVLNRIAKSSKKSLIVICDNINEWDFDGISLISNIMSPDVTNVYSSLKESQFILTINSDHNSKEIIKTKMNTIDFTKLNIAKYSKDEVLNAFKYFGVNIPKNCNDIDLCYNATLQGNLFLTYLFSQEIKNTNWDNAKTKFLNDHKIKYLDDIINDNIFKLILESTSLIEDKLYYRALRMLVNCFQREDDSTIFYALKKAKEKRILHYSKVLSDETVINFYSQAIKNYLQPKNEECRIHYYKAYMKCLSEINPFNFEIRAKYAKMIYENDLFNVFKLISNIEKLNNYKADSNFYSQLDDQHRAFLKSYMNCIEKINTKQFSSAYKIVDKMSLEINLHELMIFEIDYLKGIILSKYTDSINHKKSIQIFEKWFNNKGEFAPYIIVKSGIRLIRAYFYSEHPLKIPLTENKMVDTLTKYSRFSPQAHFYGNIIKRNASISHKVETSIKLNRDAVFYFEEISNGIYINQYYYALINLSGNLIEGGKYKKAYNESLKALNLENEFSLSGCEAIGNFVLSGFLINRISGYDGIEILDKYIKAHKLSDTIPQSYFLLSMIKANIYIYLNNPIKGLKMLEKLKDSMFLYSYTLDSHMYIANASIMTCYLLLNRRQELESLIKKNTIDHVSNFNYPFKSIIRKREIIYKKHVCQKSFNTAFEIDQFITKIPVCKNQDSLHFFKSCIWGGLQHWNIF